MKKLAILLAVLLIPCTAFGLEMLDNSALDNVTGQGGVAIAFDDVQLFLNVEKFAYIDCDGFNTNMGNGSTCAGGGAAITVDNFQMDTININMIGTAGTLATVESKTLGTSSLITGYTLAAPRNQTIGASGLELASSTCGLIPLFYDYGTGESYGCTLSGSAGTGLGLDNYLNTNILGAGAEFNAKALTIDITDRLPLMTGGFQANFALTTNSTIAGVMIGLPTFEVYINEMVITPAVDDDISTNTNDLAANDDANFGTFYMQGITFTVLNGWMEIAPTTTTPGNN